MIIYFGKSVVECGADSALVGGILDTVSGVWWCRLAILVVVGWFSLWGCFLVAAWRRSMAPVGAGEAFAGGTVWPPQGSLNGRRWLIVTRSVFGWCWVGAVFLAYLAQLLHIYYYGVVSGFP